MMPSLKRNGVTAASCAENFSNLIVIKNIFDDICRHSANHATLLEMTEEFFCKYRKCVKELRHLLWVKKFLYWLMTRCTWFCHASQDVFFLGDGTPTAVHFLVGFGGSSRMKAQETSAVWPLS